MTDIVFLERPAVALFYINLDGGPRDERGMECASLNEARNHAISRLGAELQRDPGYAIAGHWRVDVLDEARRLRCHVIVATVDAPRSLNFASYDAISADPATVSPAPPRAAHRA